MTIASGPALLGMDPAEDATWIEADDEGRFVLAGLLPGTYVVKADGSELRHGTEVSVPFAALNL